MRTKLLRITRKDLDKHKSFPMDEYEGAPMYYWYDPVTGEAELWPTDRNNVYELTLTIEERH